MYSVQSPFPMQGVQEKNVCFLKNKFSFFAPSPMANRNEQLLVAESGEWRANSNGLYTALMHAGPGRGEAV